jgi:hypothetical protein
MAVSYAVVAARGAADRLAARVALVISGLAFAFWLLMVASFFISFLYN